MSFHDQMQYQSAQGIPADYHFHSAPVYTQGDQTGHMSYCHCIPAKPRTAQPTNPNLRADLTSFARTQYEIDEIFYATFPNARPSPSSQWQEQLQVYNSEGTYYSDECLSPVTTGYYSPELFTPITPNDSFLGFDSQCDTWADLSSSSSPGMSPDTEAGQSSPLHSSAPDELLHHPFSSAVAPSPIEPDLLHERHDGPAKSHNTYPTVASPDVKEPVPRLRVRIPDSSNVYPTLTEAVSANNQVVDEPRRELKQEVVPPVALGSMTTPAVRRNAVKRLLSRSPSPEPQHVPSPTSSTASDRPPPPRKPAMSCFFCRGRKIACGQPSAESEDRTCNQCRRRSLKCEYPLESRRGMRKKKTIPDSG